MNSLTVNQAGQCKQDDTLMWDSCLPTVVVSIATKHAELVLDMLAVLFARLTGLLVVLRSTIPGRLQRLNMSSKDKVKHCRSNDYVLHQLC